MTIKKIFAIASAKGGVGKSSITAGIAIEAAKNLKVGILDADIYGPNQHLLFNVNRIKPEIIIKDKKKLFKPINSNGVLINSMGFILDNDKAALWRGPMLSGAIKQLIHSTDWGDLDILFIDMPPGTGDAYLTIAKELKPDYSILISTPNILSIHDTNKTIEMFNKLNINILGYIENNITNNINDTELSPFLDNNIDKLDSIPFSTDIYNFNPKKTHIFFQDISRLLASLV